MNPLVFLFVFPLLEIVAFIEVGDWIGTGPTIALVVLSVVLGSVLLRRQGLSVLRRAQAAADRGEVPVGAAFEGFCVVVAAFLLILPGFLSDMVGLALFVPVLRNALGRWLFDRMRTAPGVKVRFGGGFTAPGRGPSGAEVIDGDFREVNSPHAARDAPRITSPSPRPDQP